MKRWYPEANDHLAVRVLWLYGLYMLISNATFLIGYYALPEGILRTSPQTAAGRVAASGRHGGRE